MKRYKLFGQTSSPHTPIENLSFSGDNSGAGDTPTPQYRAIRNNLHPYTAERMQQERGMMQQFPPQYAPPPQPQQELYMPPPTPQQQQPYPPAPYMMQYPPPPPPSYLPSRYPSPSECELLAAHIRGCQMCARRYRKDHNTYITIIVALVLLVMFMMTKLIDRLG